MAGDDVRTDCNGDCNGSQEIAKNEPVAVSDAVAAAVDSLNNRPELNALVTGAHSEALREALAVATDAIESQVRADVNPEAMTLQRLISAFAEASSLRSALFHRMQGNPLTNKGKVRAMFNAYKEMLDREIRLAQAIGLERRPRDLNESFEAAIAAEARAYR